MTKGAPQGTTSAKASSSVRTGLALLLDKGAPPGTTSAKASSSVSNGFTLLLDSKDRRADARLHSATIQNLSARGPTLHERASLPLASP